MQDPAIENLDYLRLLIAAVRSEMDDMERLRMYSGSGLGMDSVTGEDR